jgi:biotin transport system substrate-specific component
MTTNALALPTLATTLWPASGRSLAWRNVCLALAGSLLLAVTAKIQIPFWPVPMTLQTFAVLLIGIAYGWRLGGATVALYLAEGALGLPVFAKGAGLAYLTGPTGGYLLGFLVAAVAVGWLAGRGWDRAPHTTVLAMLAGEALIFGFGVAWLTTLVGFDKAVAVGLVPFAAAEVLKVVAATALLPTLWRRLKR